MRTNAGGNDKREMLNDEFEKTRVKKNPPPAVAFQFHRFTFASFKFSLEEKDTKGLEQKGVAFDKCCAGKFSSVGEKRAKFRDAGGGWGVERCEMTGKTILVNFQWWKSKSFACAKCGS